MNETVQKLTEIKKLKGMSQESMAREIGVSLQTMNRWLRGKMNPSIHVQHKIEEFIQKNS